MTDSELIMAALRAAIEWEKSKICSYTNRYGNPILNPFLHATRQRIRQYEKLLQRMENRQ